MSLDETKQLVLENAQLQQRAQVLLGLVGNLALVHGKKKNGKVEYRLSKADQNRLNHKIDIRQLKPGTVVITLEESE